MKPVTREFKSTQVGNYIVTEAPLGNGYIIVALSSDDPNIVIGQIPSTLEGLLQLATAISTLLKELDIVDSVGVATAAEQLKLSLH